MKVNVMTVAPQFVPQFQSFVRDPTHAFAVDPEILHLPNGQVHAFGPDLRLVTLPGAVHGVGGTAPDDLAKVSAKVWAIVKPALPRHDAAIDGIEVVLAGKKFWDQITAGERAATAQVVLGGATFGLKVYGLLTDLFPQLKTADPYISPVGVIVKIADKAYAIYLTKEPS